MSRARRAVAVLVALPLMACAGLATFVRTSAGNVDEVGPVGATGVYAARNQGGIWLYGFATPDHRLALVDAGIDAQGRPIDALVAALGATRGDVRTVLVTHGHGDHTGGIASLPGARVYVGADDAPLMAHERDSRRFLPRLFALVSGVPASHATDLVTARTTIDVGGDPVTAIPFPGHTPGSTLYVAHGVLFTGDAIGFDGTALVPPPGPVTEDMDEAMRSIASLPSLLTGEAVDVVCTGHGGCTPPAKTAALLAALVR